MPTRAERALSRLRKICAALPDVEERPSHGAPTFFYRGKKSFVMFHDDHHGDGRLALWCHAGTGVQALLGTKQVRVAARVPLCDRLLRLRGALLNRASAHQVHTTICRPAQ